ncbi:ABC transporter substrate-binding protein [Hymenobacter wooponensis]|uniref:ABC transporter substrate-binding protein n=1 Tax=Hymenobacter wooponensis TaxID=1525360 RepID=A0A4Z0MP45_9BACT|nr:ABC transporter substrate-binding protein [Hymenobacter wooponensis]TGD81209.1 ABC transporter substrate-binding protein [Hymenobacter wooponensis]
MKRILAGLFLLLWSSLVGCSTTVSSAPDAVRIRWARDPENLDPLIVKTSGALEVISLLHCSLLQPSEAKGEYVPWLAQDFPQVTRIGDSLMQVTYQVRPEATWDNGKPILASDVVFTLKVMHCAGLPTELDQARFGFVRDILPDANDPRRFSLLCRGQSIDFVRSSGDFSILPEYALDPEATLRAIPVAAMGKPLPVVQAFAQRYLAGDFARHPERVPGSGPYQLENWQPGRQLTLTRKPTWWADRISSPPPQLWAYPHRINYQIIPEAATAVLALRRGDIDLYPLIPATEFARLQQSPSDRERLQFLTADSYECLTANFNMRNSLLQDQLTRQALSYLFNVPALIKASQLGHAYPSVGLISPSVKQYYNDSLPLPTHSPDQAVRLLQQAGWQRQPDRSWVKPSASGTKQPLRLSISYRAGEPSFETTALQFQAAAATIGIPIDLRPTEASLLSQQVLQGKVQILLRNMHGQPFAYDFTPILHSQSTDLYNASGFGTPSSDRLIEDIAQENSPQRKAQLLRKFQRLIYEERPLTVLYFLQYRIAAARRLGKVPVSGLMPGYVVTSIRLDSVAN